MKEALTQTQLRKNEVVMLTRNLYPSRLDRGVNIVDKGQNEKSGNAAGYESQRVNRIAGSLVIPDRLIQPISTLDRRFATTIKPAEPATFTIPSEADQIGAISTELRTIAQPGRASEHHFPERDAKTNQASPQKDTEATVGNPTKLTRSEAIHYLIRIQKRRDIVEGDPKSEKIIEEQMRKGVPRIEGAAPPAGYGSGSYQDLEHFATETQSFGRIENSMVTAAAMDYADGNNKDFLMKIVTNIISTPFEVENAGYHIGYWAGGNLEAIITEVRKLAALYRTGGVVHLEKRNTLDPNRIDSTSAPIPLDEDKARKLEAFYSQIISIKEAAPIFHKMNQAIVTNQIQGLAESSNVITAEMLQILKGRPQIARMIRLVDMTYGLILSEDGSIDSRNYTRIGGSILNDKGEVDVRTEGDAEVMLREINSAANSIADGPTKLTQVEEWEINWARYISRAMYNITFRAAEQIASGSYKALEKNIGSEYASFPQETAAKILNWKDWIIRRFNIGGSGGKVFMEMVSYFFHNIRKRYGYKDHSKMLITAIGSRDIKGLEEAGMFKMAGFFTGFRKNIAIRDTAPTVGHAGGETMGDVIEKLNKELKGAATLYKIPLPFTDIEVPIGRSDRDFHHLQVSIYEKFFLVDRGGKKVLNPAFSNALGILLKEDSLQPAPSDPKIIKEVKARIRTAIWEHLAEEDPLAMSMYVRNMKFNPGPLRINTRQKTYELELNRLFVQYTTNAKGEQVPVKTPDGRIKNSAAWDSLRAKLFRANELKMAKLANDDVSDPSNISLAKMLAAIARGDPSMAIKPEEQAILDGINKYGKMIASDLADIRWPYLNFMSDIVWEKVNFVEIGPQGYNRRITDMVTLHKTNQVATQFTAGPGMEDEFKPLLKPMKEQMYDPAVEAEGAEAAGEILEPVGAAILSNLEAGVLGMSTLWGAGGKWYKDKLTHAVMRSLYKNEIYTGIMYLLSKPTSLAKKAGGNSKAALIEYELNKAIKGIKSVGIPLNKETLAFYKKRFGTSLLWLIIAALRSFVNLSATLLPTASVHEIYKQGMKA